MNTIISMQPVIAKTQYEENEGHCELEKSRLQAKYASNYKSKQFQLS